MSRRLWALPLAGLLAAAALPVAGPAHADVVDWTVTTLVTDPHSELASLAVGPDGSVYYPDVDHDDLTADGEPIHGVVKRRFPNGTVVDTSYTFGGTVDTSEGPTSSYSIDFPYVLDVDAAGNLYGFVRTPSGRYYDFGDPESFRHPVVVEARPGHAPVTLPFDLYSNPYLYGDALDVTPAGDVYVASGGNSGNQTEHPLEILHLAPGASSATSLGAPQAGAAGHSTTGLVANDAGDVYFVDGVDGVPLDGVYERQHDQTTWTKIAESHGALDLVIDAAQRVSTVGYDLSGTSGRFLLVPVPAGDGRPTANIPGNLFDNVGGSARQAPDGSIYFIDESSENQQTVLRIKRAAPPATNAAPVAADSTRTVPGGQSSGLVLSASDPDGDALTYDVVTAPAHGSLAGTAPDLTYTPAAGYTGPDSLAYSVSDGNGGSTSATVAITVTAPGGVSSVTQHAEPGQSVSTGAAPSSGEPAQAAVTTPAAGSISIAQDPTIADPAGYAVLGSQFRIEAPAATTAAPLRLTFQLDATALPSGESAESVTVFRNGDAIARCTGEVGEATPDPCVTSRTTSEDGVVTITVLSSHASEWTLGVALKATTTTVHPVAASTYGQAVSLVATVNQPGTSSPTGSVTFKDTSANPAKVLGTATLSGGSATLPNQVLDAGEHAVVAVYSGSRTSAASTSAPVVVKVAKAPVSVTTSSTSGFVSLLTFRVGYTSTVKSTVTGLPLAGITVTTRVTGGSVNTGCTAVTNTNGVATCTAGPVQISILTPYAATTAATANYLAGTGQGFVRLF